MTQENAKKLPNGVYRVYWKTKYGKGISVAAIGETHSGSKWLAPANWLAPGNLPEWDQIDHIELIEKYEQKQWEEESNLAFLKSKSYKIQCNTLKDVLHIQLMNKNEVHFSDGNGHVILTLSGLLSALRECGYQITEPAFKGFLEIYDYLNSKEDMEQLDCIGGAVYKYYHRESNRTITIGQVPSRVEINIDNEAGPVFVGHVLSLEEFKLIWDRIL